MPDVALSLLAHPDDAEFLCAGSLIRLARAHGWQVHVASMTAGDCGSAELPADDWRKRHPDFQEPRLSRNLRLVELLQGIAARHDRTPGGVAVAWVLRDPAVTAAIVGARRPGQFRQIAGAADFRLPPEDLAAIESFLRANPA